MTLALAKSPDWHAARRLGIGGSDAGRIMAGDWHSLWMEKTGKAAPDDLSWVLPVQLGLVTEALNLAFFEHETGKTVSAQGESRTHARYPFMRCTLDGLAGDAVVQAKHVNQFAKLDEVAAKYTPQVTHEMLVCGVERSYLSVIIGTMTYEWMEIPLDDFYACALIDREREFWSYVERDVEPPNPTAIAAPVPVSEWRDVDMTGSNLWASSAVDWLACKYAVATFKASEKALKELTAADARTAYGYGIKVSRARNGALTIREGGK